MCSSRNLLSCGDALCNRLKPRSVWLGYFSHKLIGAPCIQDATDKVVYLSSAENSLRMSARQDGLKGT